VHQSAARPTGDGMPGVNGNPGACGAPARISPFTAGSFNGTTWSAGRGDNGEAGSVGSGGGGGGAGGVCGDCCDQFIAYYGLAGGGGGGGGCGGALEPVDSRAARRSPSCSSIRISSGTARSTASSPVRAEKEAMPAALHRAD
jgi:hypothetical protein